MSEEKNQAEAMLLMIYGSLLKLDQEERANILDTAESIKAWPKSWPGTWLRLRWLSLTLRCVWRVINDH